MHPQDGRIAQFGQQAFELRGEAFCGVQDYELIPAKAKSELVGEFDEELVRLVEPLVTRTTGGARDKLDAVDGLAS